MPATLEKDALVLSGPGNGAEPCPYLTRWLPPLPYPSMW